jgi:hypothetical protein
MIYLLYGTFSKNLSSNVMFKMIYILQSRIKEISKAFQSGLIFTKFQQRIAEGNAIYTEDVQITGKGQSIITKCQSIITTEKPISAQGQQTIGKEQSRIATVKTRIFKSKAPAFKSKPSGFTGKLPVVSSKSPLFKSKASSATGKPSAFNNKASGFTNKSPLFNCKAPGFNRKRSIVHSKGTLRTNMLSPEIKEFIIKADEYLHYANGMLFFICNTSSIVSFIVMRQNNDRSIPGSSILLIIFHLNKSKPVYFIIRAENANVFEGVIERYCGVPP